MAMINLKFKKITIFFMLIFFLFPFSKLAIAGGIIESTFKLGAKVAAEETIRKTFFDDDKKQRQRVIGSRELNVRNGSNAQYKIVGKVYLGEVLVTYEKVDGWTRIGHNQWVKSNYLEPL